MTIAFRNMASAWIQRADFSDEEFSGCDAAEARAIFERHDWGAERRLESELAGRGADHCPPGMGLVAEDGSILHLIPRDGSSCLLHYHPKKAGLILGLFRVGRGRGRTVEDVSTARALALVEPHFRCDSQAVMRALDGLAGAP